LVSKPLKREGKPPQMLKNMKRMSNFEDGDIDPYLGQDLQSRISNVGSKEELMKIIPRLTYSPHKPLIEGNHAYYTSNVNNDINDVELDSDVV